MGEAGFWFSFEHSVKKGELTHFRILGENKMTLISEVFELRLFKCNQLDLNCCQSQKNQDTALCPLEGKEAMPGLSCLLSVRSENRALALNPSLVSNFKASKNC